MTLISGPSPSEELAFHKVGILYHPKLAESRVMAAEMLEHIESLGASAWVRSGWDKEAIEALLPEFGGLP